MAKQVRIYSAPDEMQAEFLCQVLASHEIDARVRGGTLATLVGYLPATYGRPEVTVDEADVERARPIVERFERSRRSPRPRAGVEAGNAWICSHCGEMIEPQFTDCWKCQAPRPAGDDAVAADDAKARATPQRLPADPNISVDLACARCGYNLRNLPVDHVCPECARPALASLVQAMQAQQEWALDHEAQLAPCLDFVEQHFGFPLEAIVFATRTWRRAAEIVSGGVNEDAIPDDDFADALRVLAGGFFGDPITAARALERWGLSRGADVRRLRELLAAMNWFDGG